MFKKVDNKVNFPNLEQEIQIFWEKNNIFKKSLEKNEGHEEYVFYDGPPFATGMPHYGHLVGGTLKDVVPRYWTMMGKYVSRRFGWDCHGLPVEYEVEKDLGFKSKKDIEAFGIDKFNETCRSIVLKYVNEWEHIVKRTGRWVDFENDYKTMDANYMESVWWIFKAIWDKNYIQKGARVNPFCPRCSTPLSKHEASSNYKDVQDPAITMIFKINGEENTYLTAWTTTPWTLPSNAALAVKSDIVYVYFKLHDTNHIYVMAKERVSFYYKEEEYSVIKEVKGSDLIGLRYEPLFDYYKGCDENVHQVIGADYVTVTDGTGIVHQAPAFGQEDYEASKDYNIPLLNPIDDMGCFTNEVPDYQGIYIKDADKKIIRRLKDEGKIIRHDTNVHSYPFCWRCETELIQKATDSWVLEVEDFKKDMLKNNSTINWVPENIKYGRFGKLLEDMPEWHISRNRYWGTPLPIWICPDCGDTVCVGSIQELEELSGEKGITDIHKHFVDKITIPCQCGCSKQRTSEVLDCWFESGSMPYAQNHYPFENKEFFERNYPCDFIAEGIDQTRGWFNKLLVISTALFNKPAYKNVIVNGTVLAEDGNKMSKSKKNYPPVMNILDKYGADAMRMYLINSPAVRAENLRFSEMGIKEVIKKVTLPLWNSYSFLVTYANLDNWQPSLQNNNNLMDLSNRLDRWIMSSLQSLIKEVNTQMQDYKLYNVLPAMVEFIDNLTNWYIRRSRRRFWRSENDTDKLNAYQTLYTVLNSLIRVIAPVMPFISEAIYQNLELSISQDKPESVHLCDYPQVQDKFIDQDLEEEMSFVGTVVRLGRNLRNQRNIKIRQPLQSITIVADKNIAKRVYDNMQELILDELNIKEIHLTDKEEDLVDISSKANFRSIGKKFGKKVKEVATLIENLPVSDIRKIESGAIINIEDYQICSEDIIIRHEQKEGIFAESEGDITVSLDTTINQELKEECHIRELINRIQNIRKDYNFEIADHIRVYFSDIKGEVSQAVKKFESYILKETLSDSFLFVSKELEKSETIDINGFTCYIRVEKV